MLISDIYFLLLRYFAVLLNKLYLYVFKIMVFVFLLNKLFTKDNLAALANIQHSKVDLIQNGQNGYKRAKKKKETYTKEALWLAMACVDRVH